MARAAVFLYRLCTAGLFGAQLFFAAVAAQSVFSPEVSARPSGDPLRASAADAVGAMLARLDAATLACGGIAVVCAIVAGRKREEARRAALLPLLAAGCALASAAGTTPAIHALRAAGRAAEPEFGRLHALSAALLSLEMVLLLVASFRAPEGPPRE